MCSDINAASDRYSRAASSSSSNSQFILGTGQKVSRDSYVEVVYAAGSETRVSDEGEGGVEAHLASILLTKAGGLSRGTRLLT